MMKKNMGMLDRGMRVVFAIVVAILYFTGTIDATQTMIFGAIAVVFVLTSLVGTCPLYFPFGIDTREQNKN